METCSADWRSVPGYEGHYEVSSEGHIRSLPKTIVVTNKWGTHAREMAGKVLSPTTLNTGYQQVDLCVGGVHEKRSVHEVVALAFLGPKPAGQIVRHIDGTRKNNRADNLCYGTHAENSRDMVRHGTSTVGQQHWAAKLTTADILSIVDLATKGIPQKDIAVIFGVSRRQINNIVRGASGWTRARASGAPL